MISLLFVEINLVVTEYFRMAVRLLLLSFDQDVLCSVDGIVFAALN